MKSQRERESLENSALYAWVGTEGQQTPVGPWEARQNDQALHGEACGTALGVAAGGTWEGRVKNMRGGEAEWEQKVPDDCTFCAPTVCPQVVSQCRPHSNVFKRGAPALRGLQFICLLIHSFIIY